MRLEEIKTSEGNQMKLKCEEPKKINVGVHAGTITAVEYREKPYEYTDLVIEFEGHKLKYGLPTLVMPVSRLGKLMTLFGEVMEVGKDYDPEEIFVGKKCTFQTMNDGNFSNIVKDSVKPVTK